MGSSLERNPLPGKISRRELLKGGAAVLASFVLEACEKKTSAALKETPPPKPTEEPEPSLTFTPTATDTPLPTSTLTPTPTETPVPTEILEKKWGKIWVLGRGEATGGTEEDWLKKEDRLSNFLEEVSRQWEKQGKLLRQSEVFVGAFPQIKENEQGQPDFQSLENQEGVSLGAFILPQSGEGKIFYAQEQEEGAEINVEPISSLFAPEPKIWGNGCQQQIESFVFVSCPDGLAYKEEKIIFGADLRKLIPVMVDEEGKIKEIADKEPFIGYSFTAVPLSEEEVVPEVFFLSFNKDEGKLPHLPAGKEKLDQDQFITAFDLKTAKWHVWENSKENNYPYVGFWDLAEGTWRGEEAYNGEEGYQKLFKDLPPVPTETPLPTIAPREGVPETSLPIDPQAYSLSCESASAEITVLWYNQAVAGGGIAIPEGFKTFEDFFIAEAGLADNPVEGYCGAVNGWPSTSCDASSGAGYGVYNEPLLNGYRKLGIPAEAITIKDINDGKEELRQVLIDSYHHNQVLCLWGRWEKNPIEWRTNPRTGEEYPMAYGEHCVAGRVVSIDDNNFLIEISDPLPYDSGTRRVYTFNTLVQWMRGIGWFLAVKVG